MSPDQRSSRLAGVLYLLVVLAGPFVLLWVPHRIWVPGDASAWAASILERGMECTKWDAAAGR